MIPPRTSIAWIAVAIVTITIAAAVYVVPMPEPKASIVIDRATLLTGAGPGEEVALPATLPARGGQADGQPDGWLRDIHYRAAFDLPDSPGDNLFMLIASLERPATVALNGHQIFESGSQALWSGPLMTTPVLLQLPGPMLVPGRNELTVETEAGLIVPTRLSRIYVGRASELAPVFKLQSFLEQQLKTMAVVAHFILGVGILFLYFARPRDVLFAWLAGLVGVSFVLSTLVYLIFHPAFSGFARYVSILMPVLGLCALGVALAVIDIVPPRVLKVAALLLPAVSVPVAFLGGERVLSLLTVLDVVLLIALAVASAGVIAWGAFRRGNIDARIMLPPFFLVAWFLIHDGGVVAGLFGGSPLVTSYSRPLLLAAVTFVLMRRLSTTLGALDRSNDHLHAKLAAREAELAALHSQERSEAARLVREQERQRLTRDLHDGISGHLVSIIAMSEQPKGDLGSIEKAARGALDDLRLVIYSLDLGDRDLPLALANFRERLTPQLQRAGIKLDWATADMPDVSGVTPGNALVVLRILQEAITNAIKHGPASTITVRAAPTPDGQVAISVANDGRCFAPGSGLWSRQYAPPRPSIERRPGDTVARPRGDPHFTAAVESA